MNERLTKVKTDSAKFWSSRTKNQKGAMIGTLALIVILASVITYFSTRTQMVPLFSDLSTSESGQIATLLQAQGTKYELTAGGTSILVPESEVDALTVQLAAEGYPETGGISTSFFTENAGFGMTDNEFNVIKKAAVETEIANLVKRINGVKDAKVMITIPETSVFVTSDEQVSTASVILTTEVGQKFDDEQIKTIFNLVAKSVPNLTTDNIEISNQYAEYFDLESATATGSNINTAEGKLAAQKNIEKDLQRQVQTMLGTLMGQDKVVVSVTTDVDFKQENREENLVAPVDEENMEGIAISAQKITETYSGTGATASGVPEAEEVTDNFTDYQEGQTGNGDYERVEETVNNDVNRIQKVISESPYKVRNIGIQVMVEPPNPEDPSSLSPELQGNIQQILETIVRTSMDQEYVAALSDEEIAQRVVVVSGQQFYGKSDAEEASSNVIPWWIWVIGGILVVAIILLVFFILRSRKQQQLDEEIAMLEKQQEELIVDDLAEEKETEATIRRKQLEKMAKEKPEEFAKLLRSWIAED